MDDERNEAIGVFPGIIEARVDTHPVKENEDVAEEDGERMPHEKVLETSAGRGFKVLGLGHDRKRTDVRAAKLGVVAVMMIVGTAPNTAWAKDKNAEDPHKALGHNGMRQDSTVLLIVINDKKAQKKEPGQDTAGYFCSGVNIPDRPCHRGCQEEGGGDEVAPAFGCEIRGVRLGCNYDVFTCSHARECSVLLTRQN